MAREIALILFDVGGVLVRLDGLESFLRQVQVAMPLSQFWSQWLRSPAVRAFESGRSEPEQFASAVLAELGVELTPQAFLQSFRGWPTGLYDGAADLLESLPVQLHTALLSNSNVLHWPRVLHEMRLAELVDDCFSSHLSGCIKPDADAFEYVLDALNFAPEQVLFLDDNEPNVAAARALGMRAHVARGALDARRVLTGLGL